jgi:hypothetical protein
VIEDIKSMEGRVAALERALANATRELERVNGRQQRLLRLNGFVGGGFLVGVMMMLLGVAPAIAPVTVQSSQPLTVRAPFKVVDQSGRPVLNVEAQGPNGRGLYVYSASSQIAFMGAGQNKFGGLLVWREGGQLAAMLGDDAESRPGLFVPNASGKFVSVVSVSDDQGGAIMATSDDGSEQAQLKVKRDFAGLWYYENGKPVVKLGRGDKGTMALKINNGDDMVAGLGESLDGSGGSLLLNDPSGELRVKAAIARGSGGQVIAYGFGGQAGIATKGGVGSVFAGPVEDPVAILGQSENTSGAGRLALAAPGGGAAVQAGYQKNMGLVVTYASGKPAGILSPGLKIPGFTAGSNW